MRHSPLVLLHGFAGAPASYDATRDALRTYDGARVFAPYLVGHGPHWTAAHSAAAHPNDPFEFEVAALGQQLHRFGVASSNPAVLVGYSLGARLALGLLASHPKWFRHGVLIGVNPGLHDTQARAARRTEDERRARLLDDRGLDAFLAEWQEQSLFDSQKSLAPAVLDHQDRARRTNTASGLAHSLRRTGLAEMNDYTPRLGSLETPVHLMVGELDTKFRAIAECMRSRLPCAALAVVPGVGHNVPLEAPRALATLLDALPKDPLP